MSSEAGAPVTAFRFVVRGRVQGVGFRWWTQRQAQELGLSGTVRNRSDGAVEVLARGPADAVEALRTRLDGGPPSAHVELVESSPWEIAGDTPSGFSIL